MGNGTATPVGPLEAFPERPSRGEALETLLRHVYLVAVRLGRPTRAGLLSEGLRSPEIDEAMAELATRGLVQTTASPDRWTVPPPREAVARYAETVERRLALSRAESGQLEAIWRRAVDEQVDVTDNPDIDLLLGVDDIAERMSGMHRVATSRLWCVLEPSRAVRTLLDRALERPELVQVHAQVDVRVVLDPSLLRQPAGVAHLERSQAAGHAVRVAGVPVGVLVCDDRAGLLDLSAHDPAGEGSFEARRPGPISAMQRFIEHVWQLAAPVGPGEVTPEGAMADALGERDRRVLMLLTSGGSDQLIARQLGVSVRTVERRVRSLMERLGAATRFQAGVQAVRRGWL